MSAFEDRLAELLAQEQARIDDVVAEVRAAGLQAIAAFEKLAGQIARGEITRPQLDLAPIIAAKAKEMDDAIIANFVAAEPADTTPAHMRVPGSAQDIINGMVGRQWRPGDEDIINANMRM